MSAVWWRGSSRFRFRRLRIRLGFRSVSRRCGCRGRDRFKDMLFRGLQVQKVNVVHLDYIILREIEKEVEF